MRRVANADVKTTALVVSPLTTKKETKK